MKRIKTKIVFNQIFNIHSFLFMNINFQISLKADLNILICI